MHDIDSPQSAFRTEAENYGLPPQAEVFTENEQAELASDLMEITTEAEFENFLGDLIKKAGQAVGKFVSSPAGQKLGGLLKGAAKKLLPQAGQIIGGYIGGPTGAKVGGKLGSAATDLFEAEAEAEQLEWEAANTFVKLAGEAVKNAASAPPGNPHAIAHRALMQAASIHAPGLLAGGPPALQAPARGGASGHWVRRGNRVIVFGV